MSNRISILLTCHNRKKDTLESLSALTRAVEHAGDIISEIFLVDDASTDGTASSVKFEFPKVRIIEGDGNLFWNRGMIRAWQEAVAVESDFYLWLNDDTNLQEDAIAILLKDSGAKNHESIFCGICESSDKTYISYSGCLLRDKKRLIPTGIPQACDYFNGNVVLIPKSVFDKVGYLDSFFHHTLGDVDYGLRAKKLGVASFVSSKVVATCDRHNSLPIWCNPKYSLKQRLAHFRTPLAKNPEEIFYFEKRHTSFLMALYRASVIYIRLAFPRLWILLGKAQI
ncbi:glycosyltransferase family 2 protein [Dyadobacter sp. CY343]|uniref:glycosyltransferase family 2 protein n=1 Tax=Dyadobacter sp. CY343 TaxID=2907299 RepID=UPI001F2DF23A|nr:glycosyltransferase family 2 protein [Dyadobacter sp. CY343]MCE7059705.1 glycosyltransferase family 2 protein [Dyadobacter sp. CY343]